jgi:Ala-tRNA(Pro) deacylase
MTVTERLVALLEENGADFRVMEHEPVTTSEEASRIRGTPLEQGAKALVYRADGRAVLLVLPANRRVDTRAFKNALQVKDLKMISPEELLELTGLQVGAVPPFGNLIGLTTYADERLFEQPRLSFNAGSRSVSVILATPDYDRLVNPVKARFAAD